MKYEYIKFNPIMGRRIMVKGAIPSVDAIINDKARLLAIMSHIKVIITPEVKIPLTTFGLIENHVRTKEELKHIINESLKLNYGANWSVLAGKSGADVLWEMAQVWVRARLDEVGA